MNANRGTVTSTDSRRKQKQTILKMNFPVNFLSSVIIVSVVMMHGAHGKSPAAPANQTNDLVSSENEVSDAGVPAPIKKEPKFFDFAERKSTVDAYLAPLSAFSAQAGKITLKIKLNRVTMAGNENEINKFHQKAGESA